MQWVLLKTNISLQEHTNPTISGEASTDSATISSSQGKATWHLTFQVPSSFSISTENAISTGVLLKKHRVQSLSTGILAFTNRPDGEQYNAVCEKLITKYPTLRDYLGEKNHYVS